MQNPEIGLSDGGPSPAPEGPMPPPGPMAPPAPAAPGPVAPVWHTIILVAGILLLSIGGAMELSSAQVSVNRLQTYAMTVGSELFMLAWLYLGLRLKKVPLRSLLGSIPGDFGSIIADVGIGIVFWICSLFVLGTIGIFWTVIEAAITHHSLFPSGNQLAQDPSQQQTLHTLTQLAPSNGREIAAWILVCIVAGIIEEMVFRGYLQRQFTALSKGTVAVGVVVSALLFGAAHGYQGARSMVLLAVFGVLFSLLSLFRRSLRPGIIAHSWQDIFAGLVLAFLKAHHKL